MFRTSTRSETTLLPARLTKIDETNRADHPFLKDGDRCYFFGEYFAGKGYQGGGTNQLIFNYKCSPTDVAKKPARGTYKDSAIRTIAAGLRKAFPSTLAERYTWVPIPTSKLPNHVDYDDRLVRSLELAFDGFDIDIRLLIQQTASTESDHTKDDRLTSEQLYELLHVENALVARAPVRGGIVLFDDVITTGKHFRCCERRLREVITADVPIFGVFVARRILPSAAEAFEDLTTP